ncbi:WAT1-related protein At2g39510 isoform X2 [Sesamum indicum]|uniref:WAT1-related protein n=1 Tax=Sesamum indicum TaxID=4182 RepID=A0A6I9SR44_SESIN|nr:WAT1-related protein At2g39510 isoform X2 [Sesamum indicum]
MDSKFLRKAKPYLAVIMLQFGSTGSAIIAKSALNHGMSHYTFSVYRNIVATVVMAPFALVLERKIRPRMTFSIFYKIVLLALLEPVIDQNLYYAGMKYTTATFASAMCNVLPAITFLLAWALGLERVNIKRWSSQAKVAGTLVTVSGAMIMTLVRGSIIGLPWTRHSHINSQLTAADADANSHQNPVRGALMITAGCFCWSIFYILQAITLKSYPAGLSLTALICMGGALQGTALTLVAEKSNTAIWTIRGDTKLLAYVYSGLVGSGITYYVAGVVSKEKGPVFATSFNPLSMVFVAVMSSFILAEQLDVGKVSGAIVIVVGLYLFIWGKAKDKKESLTLNAQSEMVVEKQGSATNSSTNASKDNQSDVSKAISCDNVV